MNEPTPTAQFNTEGQPAFPVADTENENSTDSPSVEPKETVIVKTQPDGGEPNPDDITVGDDPSNEPTDPNLADHPRWKEREEDWKTRFNDQETRHTDALTTMREELDEKYGKPQGNNAPTTVPSWFGGDEQQFADFQIYNQSLIDEAKENIQKGITKKSEVEQTAIKTATDYMNTEISSIESNKVLNPEGVNIDKNKLLKFVLDNELVDTKGQWNYKAGWQLMKAGVKSAKNKTIDEKKQVAGATITDGPAGSDKPAYTTSEDFQNPTNRPW